MKFKIATHCAIEAVAIIAKADGYVPVKKIVAETEYSHSFVAKNVQQLVTGGILKSASGPKGGYKLISTKTTLLDVMIAMDGEVGLGVCGNKTVDKIFENITILALHAFSVPVIHL